MKPLVKKKWVEALRSGEFEQTKGNLCDSTGYCCLGVLSELAVREGKADKWKADDGDDVFFFGKKRGDADDTFLPRSVMRWAGLDSDSPAVEGDSLAVLNDNGKTFEEIADLIEKHL